VVIPRDYRPKYYGLSLSPEMRNHVDDRIRFFGSFVNYVRYLILQDMNTGKPKSLETTKPKPTPLPKVDAGRNSVNNYVKQPYMWELKEVLKNRKIFDD